jgi:hypothetical protein
MSDSLAISYASVWVLFLTLGMPEAVAGQHAQLQNDWVSVRGIAKGIKVELHPYDAPRLRGQLVQVTDESITISVKNRERVFTRGEVHIIKVPSGTRRILHGAIGVGVGVVLGFLACPTCANEGREDIAARNIGIGAGVGSLAFLIPGYRTLYKAPKQAKPPKSTP